MSPSSGMLPSTELTPTGRHQRALQRQLVLAAGRYSRRRWRRSRGRAARASLTLITLFLEVKGKFQFSTVMPSPPIRSPMPVSEPAENRRASKGWLTIWKSVDVELAGEIGRGRPDVGGSLAWPGRLTVSGQFAAAHAFKGEQAARQQPGIAGGQRHLAPGCAWFRDWRRCARLLPVLVTIAADSVSADGPVADAGKIQIERRDRHAVAHRQPVQPGVDMEAARRACRRRLRLRGVAAAAARWSRCGRSWSRPANGRAA